MPEKDTWFAESRGDRRTAVSEMKSRSTLFFFAGENLNVGLWLSQTKEGGGFPAVGSWWADFNSSHYKWADAYIKNLIYSFKRKS